METSSGHSFFFYIVFQCLRSDVVTFEIVIFIPWQKHLFGACTDSI